jgi:hypothetical protein
MFNIVFKLMIFIFLESPLVYILLSWFQSLYALINLSIWLHMILIYIQWCWLARHSGLKMKSSCFYLPSLSDLIFSIPDSCFELESFFMNIFSNLLYRWLYLTFSWVIQLQNDWFICYVLFVKLLGSFLNFQKRSFFIKL